MGRVTRHTGMTGKVLAHTHTQIHTYARIHVCIHTQTWPLCVRTDIELLQHVYLRVLLHNPFPYPKPPFPGKTHNAK